MFQVDEIVWGHIRGFPWWPGRVVEPTPDQLKKFSIEKTPPDQRLVWFFNDNDRYTLLNTKNLRPFDDEDLKNQIEKRGGKASASLRTAFEQASAESQPSLNLETDRIVDADAIIVTPPNSRSTARQPRKTKKRKPSALQRSPPSGRLTDPVQSNKKRRAGTSKHAPQDEPKSTSHVRKIKLTSRLLEDAESDKLSTDCIPSPCNLSSQETGVDSRPNATGREHIPPRSNMLRLRVREKNSPKHLDKDQKRIEHIASSTRRQSKRRSAHHMSDEDQPQRKEPPGLPRNGATSDHTKNRSADYVTSTDTRAARGNRANHVKRDRKSRASYLPPKLRHVDLYNSENATKKEDQDVGEIAADEVKPETATLPDSPSAKASVTLSGDDNMKAQVSLVKRRLAKPGPSTTVNEITQSERVRRSDTPLRRSGRMRKVSSKMIGVEEESERENEGDERQQAGSKRSRGVEAPRKSDGQRRRYIRQEKKVGECAEDRSNEGDGKGPYDAINEAAKPFRELTKEECIKVILRLQDDLRRKSVQLWLRGRKLVEAREVVRTEEELVRACESGIEMAEHFLDWAKKHKQCDKENGSRFSKMEERAVEECEALCNVYFDRRRVRLDNLGLRVLKLTKEMQPFSRQLTSVLQDLVVLWLDLTTVSPRLPNFK